MKSIGLIIICLVGYRFCGETKFLIELYRHGARLPTAMPKNPIPFDPTLLPGDLTTTGLTQHYLFGLQIRRTYRNLIPVVFSPAKHSLYSSAYNRTIDSAIAHMMGLYPLGTGPEIEVDDKLLYNPPIKEFDFPYKYGKAALPQMFSPIIYTSTDFDTNHIFEPYNCKIFVEKIKSTKAATDSLKDGFSTLYRQLVLEGFKPSDYNADFFNFEVSGDACDVIISRAYSDKSFSVSESLIDQCHLRHTAGDFAKVSNIEAVRYGVTPMMKIMKKKLTTFRETDEKVLSFSGHDTNIILMLTLFYPNNYNCVLNYYRKKYKPEEYDPKSLEWCILYTKFTSNIVWEVFYTSPTSLMLMMKMNNEPLPVFNGKSIIPLSEFITFLDENIREDWEEQCLFKKPSKFGFLSFLLIVSLIMIAVAMILVFVLIIKRKNESKYSLMSLGD